MSVGVSRFLLRSVGDGVSVAEAVKLAVADAGFVETVGVPEADGVSVEVADDVEEAVAGASGVDVDVAVVVGCCVWVGEAGEVGVEVGVLVGGLVAVGDGFGVAVAVAVGAVVEVSEGLVVAVAVGLDVAVGVFVLVAVNVTVGVEVEVAVAVGVAVGCWTTIRNPSSPSVSAKVPPPRPLSHAMVAVFDENDHDWPPVAELGTVA